MVWPAPHEPHSGPHPPTDEPAHTDADKSHTDVEVDTASSLLYGTHPPMTSSPLHHYPY